MDRAANLARLREEAFDVLVIGGGATGSGVALDAASRGLRTALVEAGDFASGTSSRSTKLVHGGVRYLERAVTHLDRAQFHLVREALAELTDEGVMDRRKRQSEGAGNNPYEYTAIPPSELVGSVVGRVQDELNTLFNLDRHLADDEPTTEPVSIEVTADEEDEDEADDGANPNP